MIQTYWQVVVESTPIIKDRIIEIITSPVNNPEMLWLLAPLLLTLFLMELYFGRNKEEELGWNTAFGNVLVLIFVSAYLANHIYQNALITDPIKVSIAATVIFMGLILMLIDFFHLLPKKIAFQISSKLPINYMAFVAIILVYTDIAIDRFTTIAFSLILIALSIFIGLVHILIPKVRDRIMPPAPKPTKNKKISAPDYKEST